MSDFAILSTGKDRHRRVVRLSTDGSKLCLSGADGWSEAVPWWKLYRLADQGTTHRFSRLDRTSWELSVTAGADRALLAHVGRRPLQRLTHPFHRLHAFKILLGLLVVIGTVVEHTPSEWTAKLIPEAAQRRLIEPIIAQRAPGRCSHEGGEAAVRKLLVRLDPEIGTKVEIDAFNDSDFLVASAPSRKLFILRYSLTEVNVDALAALLAHELSHIRHGDPTVATVRYRGFLSTWAAILEASANYEMIMNFSGLEERRADLEAMQMMRRAGIPLRPAAEMFERMRVSKAQGGHFAESQRDFHFGLDARSQRWAVAARSDPPTFAPVLTKDEADAIFNYCWQGRILPLPGSSGPPPQERPPAGQGGIPPRKQPVKQT